MAKFELLFASVANSANMPCPHHERGGLKGQCSLQAKKSAEHSREEQTLRPVFWSLHAGSAAYQPLRTLVAS